MTAYVPGHASAIKVPANEWVSYYRTVPEPEYPSGSVCWCTVYAEWLQKWLTLAEGTTNKDVPFSWGQGCSDNEPGVTPQAPVTFSVNFQSTKQFVDICSLGRLAAGVHFRFSTKAGYDLCKGMAEIAWAKMAPTS